MHDYLKTSFTEISQGAQFSTRSVPEIAYQLTVTVHRVPMARFPVASLGWVSPGAVTDGATLVFAKKTLTIFF